MRASSHVVEVLILAGLILSSAAQAQTDPKLPSKIFSARTVWFIDETGSASVADKTREQLKKWGRFRIVTKVKQADLVILLSADPYKGGHITTAGGETGTIDPNGHVRTDSAPSFNRLSPTRYAYLTVIDPATEETLWSHSHPWGGLLTGFNSVGERLVKRLEKDMGK